MSRRRVILDPEADRDIQRHDQWWRRNRLDSPGLFGRALAEALQEIRGMAGIGSLVDSEHLPGVRRYLVTPTRHWLYYIPIDHSLRPYLLVLGVQGPGEAELPDGVRRS